MEHYDFERDLLSDPNFRRLLVRFSREAITWDEFLNAPLPVNLSAMKTWELLNELSRDIGVGLPIRDLDDNEFWYRRTFRLTDAVSTVTCACMSDSRLHRTMTASAGHHFLRKARITETIAAAKLDGLDIADAEGMLQMNRAPQNAAERLVTNTFSAMDSLGDFVDEPFSRELFRSLRERLLEGVDRAALTVSKPGMGLVSFDYTDERVSEFADRQLGYIIAYANHETGDEYDHSLLRALLITDVFRLYRPLGGVSSQVGRLASRLYGLKNNLPVLGALPISQAKLDWELGLIAPPTVTYEPVAYQTLIARSPGDLTAYQTLSAELALLTLRAAQRYVDSWERRDSEMREILRKDPLLNQRQRSILARALRVEDAEFNIRYHQNTHNIAYTTARRDLLELAEKGYLSVHERGKAFIFIAAPGLAQRVKEGPER